MARVGVRPRIREAQGLLLHFHDYYCCPLPYGQGSGRVGGWVGAASGPMGLATVPRYTHTIDMLSGHMAKSFYI